MFWNYWISSFMMLLENIPNFCTIFDLRIYQVSYFVRYTNTIFVLIKKNWDRFHTTDAYFFAWMKNDWMKNTGIMKTIVPQNTKIVEIPMQ